MLLLYTSVECQDQAEVIIDFLESAGIPFEERNVSAAPGTCQKSNASESAVDAVDGQGGTNRVVIDTKSVHAV